MHTRATQSVAVHALVLVGVALLLFAPPVSAQGIYAGGGLGQTMLTAEFQGVSFQPKTVDDTVNSWKVFGGTTGRFFGVEGGRRDFGTAKTSIAGVDVRSGTTAWDVEAIGRLRVPILDVFAKAGKMWWNRETRVGSVSENTKGTNFFWGAGVGVHFGPLGARVEWEWLDIGEPYKLSMVSVSGTIGF